MTSSTYLTAAAALTLAALAPSTALACGGLFCSQVPVEQAAERIVFAIDEEQGLVTTHVQIFYEGAADDFAWVVPVPSNPELFLSTDRLFDQLASQTQPTFELEQFDVGYCDLDDTFTVPLAGSAVDEASTATVDVVAMSKVGPYDTVVLQAETSEGLIAWLIDHDYDIPPALDPVLAPYVAADQYFVALRLSNDRDAGDIEPLGMTYAADKATIPIQLTSVAATPDMRLEAYVFGAARAVPESYLHVQINEMALDWSAGGWNYPDVITRAADEAGGHAFATDFSGSTEPFRGSIYPEDAWDIAELEALDHPADFVERVMGWGLTFNSVLLDLFSIHIPVPPASGLTPGEFYGCPDCYRDWYDEIEFDPIELAADIDEFIIEPIRNAEALLTDFPHLSRLTSSLSPVEMTVDPTFVLNRDMDQEVSNQHRAGMARVCGMGTPRMDAPMQLILEDGRTLLLPSENWFLENNVAYLEFIEDLAQVNALIIEETGPNGQPIVLFDYTDDAFDALDDHNNGTKAMLEDGSACSGCASTTTPAGAGLFGLALVGLALRRRRCE